MTTARVAITDSLRLLRVVAAEEEPLAYQLSDGLRFLNRKLHNLKARNADIGFKNITADDAIPLPDEHIDPVIYVLAATLAPLYGVQMTPEVAVEAKSGMATLQNAYRRVGRLKVDEAIQERLGRRGYYDGVDNG